MRRVLGALLLLVGLVPATLHAVPTPSYASFEAATDLPRSYFGTHYYASGTGRFTTVDPLLDVQKAQVDPQLWNRYAYVRNNPLRFVDPDGRELKLAVHYVGVPRDTAIAVVNTLVKNLTGAGVKNVSFELKKGPPNLLTLLSYELLPTPHSHLLEIRADRSGRPKIRSQEAGHNWDFGGHSAVATSAVRARARSSEDLVTGVSNVATHEVAHDALEHSSSHDFMKGEGASSDRWLFDRTLGFSERQSRRLQEKYNRPDDQSTASHWHCGPGDRGNL
jgi:RHS repeat-associated protein